MSQSPSLSGLRDLDVVGKRITISTHTKAATPNASAKAAAALVRAGLVTTRCSSTATGRPSAPGSTPRGSSLAPRPFSGLLIATSHLRPRAVPLRSPHPGAGNNLLGAPRDACPDRTRSNPITGPRCHTPQDS
ncbi:hypothetical protein SIM91_02910 [Rhodococcus opacus]|uniref:hypothetical protein n=1 Tax=Rhodococcus opacus TaxID=37919 RepID=UPI0012DAC800|nr:hypothetical protein [Rhodococcus opacus]MDX5962293.1 hypothetical protein [Rhodococcus opacus]NKY74815.1 hypothetical protein [Rhodococcus opacus]